MGKGVMGKKSFGCDPYAMSSNPGEIEVQVWNSVKVGFEPNM